MKSKHIIKSLLALGVAATIGLGTAAFARDKDKDEAALESQAKVTKAAAEATALGKVPGGTVKKSEVEKEDGVLIWSIDITTPGSKDTTEVNIDATTGKVIKVEVETAEKEKKEKEADGK